MLLFSYVVGYNRICADEGCSLVLYDTVFISTYTIVSATFPASVFRWVPEK